MKRRILGLSVASSLVLSMSLAVPASAIPPTELEVDPFYQDLFCAGSSDRAYWDVYLYGGGSGQYKVVVYWGDGSPGNTTWHAGTYITHHNYQCAGNNYFYQSWSGWRSGGGWDYDTSQVSAYG